MSRLLVLGAAPLPFEPMERQYAANLRTWHLVKPLLEDGHEVLLVACRLPNTYPEGVEPHTVHREGGLEYHSLDGPLFEDPGVVQEMADRFDPHAVIGVNSYPASRAARIETEKPIWCDMNGWLPAEAQTKAHVYDDDRYISHFWKIEKAVLDRADVLSTVSEAQAHAMVGELAARGRLGKANFGHRFVHRIPNAVTEVPMVHTRKVARGVLVPEDAFLVLWLGGYNTWTDVDLLYTSLARAMAAVPRLCFVSTGGVIEGHDELTFTRFREACAASPHRERFHFVGWVPTADVPNYTFESDLGLNVDSDNYETTYGARNRINEMAKAGLPVLSTLGTEISHILAGRELLLSAPIGDAEAFAERMIWAAEHSAEQRSRAQAAQAYVEEEFSYARTTRPLRRWAKAPTRAPDLGRRLEFQDIDFFREVPEPATAEEPDAAPRLPARSGPPTSGPGQALSPRPMKPHPSAGKSHLRAVLVSAVLLAACGPEPFDPERAAIVQRLIAEDPYERFEPLRLGRARSLFRWELATPEDLKPWKPRKGGPPLELFKKTLLLDLRKQAASLGRAVDFEASEVDMLRLHLAGLRKGEIRLAWAREGETLGRTRRLALQARQNDPGEPDSYTFDLRSHPEWRGKIRRLRFEVHGPRGQSARLAAVEGLALDLPPEALADLLERPWKVDLGHDLRNALATLPGLAREFTVEVPAGGGALAFAYAPDPGNPAPPTFRVLASAEGGSEHLLFEERVPEAAAPEASAWREARVDLSEHAGRTLRLELLTVGPAEEPLSSLAYWANPRILGPREEPAPPNLILVVLDTLRADRLSLYGHGRPTSPAIDAWAARRAVTFESTVAPAPWTLPSHISLFTGLDSLSHGLNHDLPAPPGLDTLAERLRAAGYRTVAITGGVYLDPRYGLHQGFDRFLYWPASKPQGEELEAGIEAVLETLGEAREQPFFLFFHTYEIHSPFEARQPFLDRLAGAHAEEAEALAPKLASRILPLEEEEGYTVRRRYILKSRESAEPPTLPAESLPRVADLYDSGIAYVDSHMGRLFAALGESGLDDRTALVLTSDHGEALGERGHAGHSYLYDHNLMVPFVLSLPEGRGAGRRVERQVRSIDIPATLLDLAGLGADPAMDGRSVLELVASPGTPGPREAWSYASSSNFGISLRLGDRLKYTWNNTAWPPVSGRESLYRLDEDPGEEQDLASREPERLADLRERVRERYGERFQGLRAELTSTGPLSLRLNGARFLATAKVKTTSVDGTVERLGRGKGIEARLAEAGRLTLFFESVDPSETLQLEALRPGFSPCRHLLDLERLGGPWHLDLAEGACTPGAAGQGGQGLRLTLEGRTEPATAPTPLDPEMEEKLRALGYLD